MRLFNHWKLTAKVLPVVGLALFLKFAVHALELEVLELSALFSGMLGAAVFLLGFMIAGTLGDYKESERLPSELAASLHSIADECKIVSASNNGTKSAKAAYKSLEEIANESLGWLRNNTTTELVLRKIENLSASLVKIEPYTQATYISRVKGEQNQLRKIILRMQTIRDTSFIGTGYAIAELSTFLLLIGLIFTKNQPFPESVFFIGSMTLILTYMIALITELDNPFNYSGESDGCEVPLVPLENFLLRVSASNNVKRKISEAK